jgi:hypothetical protein
MHAKEHNVVDGDGADKDSIWADPTGDEEAAAPDDAAEPAATDGDGPDEPLGGDESAGGDEPLADDEWQDDDGQQKRTVLIAQIALVVLVLIGLGVILAVKSRDDGDKKDDKTAQVSDGSSDDGTTTPTTKDGKPKKPDWPKISANRPPALGKRGQVAKDVKSTAKPGVYIWNDFDGWHMWIVGGAGMPATISGTITSNDDIGRADPAIEGTGTSTVTGKIATFDMPTDKPITGVDFNPGFYANKLVFAINGPDGPLDAALVKLGGGMKASSFPLVLEKSVQP